MMDYKCPICGKIMEKGFLYNGYKIKWTPIGQRKSLIANLVLEGEISLKPFSHFKGSRIETYRCPQCNIFIIKQ